MATWSDVDRAADKIEQLDKAQIEELLRVIPPASENPTFLARRDHLLGRIQRRHSHLLAEESSQKGGNDRTDDHWYKKPVGIVLLGVSVSLLVMLIKFLLGV
jgi:hypothetical protein